MPQGWLSYPLWQCQFLTRADPNRHEVNAEHVFQIQHNMSQGIVTFGPVFGKDFLLKVRDLQMDIQNVSHVFTREFSGRWTYPTLQLQLLAFYFGCVQLGREDGQPLEKICFAPLHNQFSGPVTVDKCTIQTIWGYFQNSLETFNIEGEKDGFKTNYLNVIYDCLQ